MTSSEAKSDKTFPILELQIEIELLIVVDSGFTFQVQAQRQPSGDLVRLCHVVSTHTSIAIE